MNKFMVGRELDMVELKKEIKLYIRIKWWVLAVIVALIAGEKLFGVIGWIAAASSFITLAMAAGTNLWLSSAVKRIKFTPLITYFSLSFDLLLIIVALYFNGGLENTWLFLPVIVIFVSGYLFTLRVSIAYAVISFFAIFIMFILEYYRIIPHFSIYNLPELYWRNLERCFDYLIGMFLLYFSAAFTSGYFNQILRQAAAELEEARSDLEKKVSERTADLEKSRKVILQMHEELKGDLVKLQTVDRMKTEFLSMISHELKTPLAPIYSYLELLKDKVIGPINQKQKEALLAIKKQSEHLNSLIDSLLDISRLELGKPVLIERRPLSYKKIIEDTVEVMRLDIEKKGLELEVKAPPDLPSLLGGEAKLKRLITNLLGNAQKFTPKGGKITIKVFEEDGSIQTQIIDTGIGIAPEHLEKIFEKFYQVDSSYTREAGGIGMGLTIAKETVEAHGGKIWAESEGLEKGARFCFTLPLT